MMLNLEQARCPLPLDVLQAVQAAVGGLVLEVPDFTTDPPQAIALWWLATLRPWRGFLMPLWSDGLLPPCNLNGLVAEGHDLRESDLLGADLHTCTFHKVDFSSALLSHCRCYSTVFKDCTFDLASLEFSEFYDCQFDHCSFGGASLHQSRLEGNLFLEANLERAELILCALVHNRWNQGKFERLRVLDSAIERDRFEGCSWRRAAFPGTRFAACSLVNASELEMPSFDGARLDPDTVQDWYHQAGEDE